MLDEKQKIPAGLFRNQRFGLGLVSGATWVKVGKALNSLAMPGYQICRQVDFCFSSAKYHVIIYFSTVTAKYNLMKTLLFCVPVIFLGCSGSVWAYLDPGTGSMLLQVILGGLAAVGVVLKMYWYRIKTTLGFGAKTLADE